MNKLKNIKLAKEWYGETKNTSGKRLIDHALETVDCLEKALNKKEISPEERQIIYLSCLGHDLFEDTTISENEVMDKWGPEVVLIIKSLTNLKGDGNFDSYIENLKIADDRVRLVKLADIMANLKDSIERFEDMDKDWLKSFWIPLLKRYRDNLLGILWKKYPKTGGNLEKNIESDIQTLEAMTNE